MTRKTTTTTAVKVPCSTAERAVVTLSWTADAAARTEHPDAERPTLNGLEEGQIAAEDGLADVERQLEEAASLCRTLGGSVNAPGVELAVALRVIADRVDNIRFQLGDETARIEPLANLAAWYRRSVEAQAVTR